MAFYDALFDDPAVIDGVQGLRAETAMEIADIAGTENCVAVTPLELSDLLALRRIPVLIDARMQKRHVTPDFRFYVGLAVGLGPNFIIGENCDIAVETRPVKSGAIIETGATDEFDGVPSPLGGAGKERFVYAQTSGIFHTPDRNWHARLSRSGLGNLNGQTIRAPIDGVLRGAGARRRLRPGRRQIAGSRSARSPRAMDRTRHPRPRHSRRHRPGHSPGAEAAQARPASGADRALIVSLAVPRAKLERLLFDDAPYGDLTTDLLGVSAQPGLMIFSARGPMVLALSAEAAAILESLAPRSNVSRRTASSSPRAPKSCAQEVRRARCCAAGKWRRP